MVSPDRTAESPVRLGEPSSPSTRFTLGEAAERPIAWPHGGGPPGGGRDQGTTRADHRRCSRRSSARRVSRPRLLALCAGAPRKLTVIRAPAGWGKSTLLAEWHAAARPSPAALRLAGPRPRGQRPGPLLDLPHRGPAHPAPRRGHDVAAHPRGGAGSTSSDDVLPALGNELATSDARDRAGPRRLPPDHQPADPGEPRRLRRPPPPRARRARARDAVDARAAAGAPACPGRARRDRRRRPELLGRGHRVAAERAARARVGPRRRRRGCRSAPRAGPPGSTSPRSPSGVADPAYAEEFVREFAGDDRHVVDYLSAEVLSGQTASRSAPSSCGPPLLDRFCAPLCDVVTGEQDARRILREMESSNFFLIPLDSKRVWYRYHHLFAELLRQELALVEPASISTLHRRASAWHRDHGTPSEAIRHATAAGDVADATALILDLLDPRPGPRPPADDPGVARRPAGGRRDRRPAARPGQGHHPAGDRPDDRGRPTGWRPPSAGPSHRSSGRAPTPWRPGSPPAARSTSTSTGTRAGSCDTAASSPHRGGDSGSGYWHSALLTTLGTAQFATGAGRRRPRAPWNGPSTPAWRRATPSRWPTPWAGPWSRTSRTAGPTAPAPSSSRSTPT